MHQHDSRKNDFRILEVRGSIPLVSTTENTRVPVIGNPFIMFKWCQNWCQSLKKCDKTEQFFLTFVNMTGYFVPVFFLS